MKYKVTSVGMDRETRQRIPFKGRYKERTETVDISTWGLGDPENALEVEQMYEAFWNDLNPNSEVVVKVIDVKEVA